MLIKLTHEVCWWHLGWMVQQVATSCKLISACPSINSPHVVVARKMSNESIFKMLFRASNRLQNRLGHPSMDTCCCIIIISDHKHSENFSQWLKAPTTSSSIQKIETESSEVERKWKVNKVKDADDGWWCKNGSEIAAQVAPRGEVVISNHELEEFREFLTL